MPRRSNLASHSAGKRTVTNGRGAIAATPRPSLRIATVSHTLDLRLAERLREFAFRQRVSESAVIEHALRTFFDGGSDVELGSELRQAGASLRRRV